MPYLKQHKQRTRERILRSAALLFASQGFERTSIEAVMAHSQLTRGAFYAHFRSKADLYREAMETAASVASPPGTHGARWLEDIFAVARKSGPWSFLATDATSPAPEVRAAYAQAIRALCRKVEQQLGAGQRSGDAARSAVATIVGVLAVSATVDDAPLRDAMATACSEQLARLEEVARPRERETFFWSTHVDVAAPLH